MANIFAAISIIAMILIFDIAIYASAWSYKEAIAKIIITNIILGGLALYLFCR